MIFHGKASLYLEMEPNPLAGSGSRGNGGGSLDKTGSGIPRRRRPGPETWTFPGEAGAVGAAGETVAVLGGGRGSEMEADRHGPAEQVGARENYFLGRGSGLSLRPTK
jgi:hypothetical protein